MLQPPREQLHPTHQAAGLGGGTGQAAQGTADKPACQSTSFRKPAGIFGDLAAMHPKENMAALGGWLLKHSPEQSPSAGAEAPSVLCTAVLLLWCIKQSLARTKY